MNHTERKHAKYSASSMERLEACPASAEASEGIPDKSNPWSIEGTEAHDVLEQILTVSRAAGAHRIFYPKFSSGTDKTMIHHATHAANFILGIWGKAPGSTLLVEDKVDLEFIHPDTGGSLDSSVVEEFGVLDVFDYKYGVKMVSPVQNLQMLTYAVGIAHKYNWNFKRIRMWIIQPRVRGYDGPMFWEIPTIEMKNVYLPRIEKIIDRAVNESDAFVEGPHCHWCKANKPGKCPLKTENKLEKAKSIFTPVGGKHDGDEKEEEFKSEADWKKASRHKTKGRGQNKTETAHTKGEGTGAAQGTRRDAKSVFSRC